MAVPTIPEISPIIKDEEVPPNWWKETLSSSEINSDSDFKEVISDSYLHTFVEFYSEACPGCYAM